MYWINKLYKEIARKQVYTHTYGKNNMQENEKHQIKRGRESNI